MEVEGDKPRGVAMRYLLVLWLAGLSALAYVDRTNISIARIAIGREFSIDNVRMGWVFSAFLVGYAAFQIPAGLLARRLGPRRSLALLGAWWGVFIALTAAIGVHATNALVLLVLIRFTLGVGEAVMYPATSQFVERWFPIQERGRANGIIFAGVGLGSMLTPPVVTAILLHHGWRVSFLLSAAAGAIAGLVWYIAARDTPEQHPLAGERERTLILRERRAMHASENGPAGHRWSVPWAQIVRSRSVLAMLASYFSYGYVAWIFFAWMYTYMAQVRGVNLKASALYTMLPFLGMTIGSLSGGAICDWIAVRFGLRAGRCGLPTVAFALTAALLLAGSAAHKPGAAAVLLAGGAGALYLAQSSYWAVCADVAGEFTSVVTGIVNMGGQIGGAVTASLTPLLAAHFGWGASFGAAAGLAVLGALSWLTVDPRCPLGTPEPLAIEI
ncbi:MAG TPA: MFS transporter [Acidobacteriaceae bacterium]|nr:MFS transporter [Acidobacteriaceae bacterium]